MNHRELIASLTLPVQRRNAEWLTWVTLAGCYLVWGSAVALHESLGFLWWLPAAIAATLHSSLQHEVLHGHPTRRRWLNESLIILPLAVWYPYRRYRRLHLRHHIDTHLTDPLDDPESWYVLESDWIRTSPLHRRLLQFNRTLLGRLLVGPPLAVSGLWRADWRLISRGDRQVAMDWLLYFPGLLLLWWLTSQAGIAWWHYLLLVSYPSMSLLLVRSYIEHRASPEVAQRTAVVEAGPLMSLLFLNNNLHWVHHRYPALAWYRLPSVWRSERSQVLAANGGYYLPGGYRQVFRRWFLTPREPVVHPFADDRRGWRPDVDSAKPELPVSHGKI